MAQTRLSGQPDIRLLLADVDGTLVPKDKVLTEATKEVVRELRRAGVFFAITSGRPPRGMSMLIEPLDLQCAIAGFDGGVFVNPDLSVIESHTLDPAAAKQTVKLFLDQGLDVWVYTEDEWLIRDREAPYVSRETNTVKFDAKVVAFFTDVHLEHAVKITGILQRSRLGCGLRKDGAEQPRCQGERSTLAALLSRRNQPRGHQRNRRSDPVQASNHCARPDRHHGGHAE